MPAIQSLLQKSSAFEEMTSVPQAPGSHAFPENMNSEIPVVLIRVID